MQCYRKGIKCYRKRKRGIKKAQRQHNRYRRGYLLQENLRNIFQNFRSLVHNPI